MIYSSYKLVRKPSIRDPAAVGRASVVAELAAPEEHLGLDPRARLQGL